MEEKSNSHIQTDVQLAQNAFIAFCSKKLTIKRLFYPEIPIDKHYINLSVIPSDDQENKVQKLTELSKSGCYDESFEAYTNLYGEENRIIDQWHYFKGHLVA